MGYVIGKGLGKRQDGRSEPVPSGAAPLQKASPGLGFHGTVTHRTDLGCLPAPLGYPHELAGVAHGQIDFGRVCSEPEESESVFRVGHYSDRIATRPRFSDRLRSNARVV